MPVTKYSERDPKAAKAAKAEPTSGKQAGDDALLELARERFRIAADAEDDRRQRQLYDLKFSYGRKNENESYQYSAEDNSLRKGRPMLTNNRIGPHCRQTANQIQEANQGIKVLPIDNGADPEKAEIRQGVFRVIEARSTAPYLEPSQHQIRMGEGFVRVVQQYVKGQSGLQELVIVGVSNRFSVYADPADRSLVGKGWRYLFFTEDLEKKEYDKRYSHSEAATLTSFTGYGDTAPDWFKNGSIRVAEYFYVDETWKDGECVERKVRWIKMNGIEVLGRRTLPISMIPAARMVGEVVDIEGKVDYRGVVPDAHDPQKFLNYAESAMAEAFGVAPKAPHVGYAASFAGHPEWDTANSTNWSKLEANTVDPENKQVGILPLPQRNVTSPEIQAMVFAGQRAENNLRAALGVMDVDASERAKEQSGRAIKQRQMQSDMSNSHFAKNQALAIQQIGRILDEWVPFIYDAPRVMEIIGKDEQRKHVMVYSGKEMAPKEPPPGIDPSKVYDLSIGRYDIEISVGPSYQTRRQEAVEMMTQVISAEPALLQTMGDLYFGNMDWPEAQAIADRFKKLLPPQLQDKQPGQQEIPPEIQQQMEQAKQEMQLLAKELQARTEEVERQTAKAQAEAQIKAEQIQSAERLKLAELASEEKIAAAKLEMELRIAQMKMANERAVASLKAEQAANQQAGEAWEGERQRDHEREQHAVDLQSSAAESDTQREHERKMQKEAPKPNGSGA